MAAANYTSAPLLLLLCLFAAGFRASSAVLVKEEPLVLKYHNGTLLKGTVTVNLVWYGKFTPAQRAIIVDFLQSLNSLKSAAPSAASWWKITGKFKAGGSSTVVVGKQILVETYPLGKSLKNYQIAYLASKGGSFGGGVNGVNLVLTAKDAFAWVGNSETQCPGYCAWPFHQPIYGPQTPPLVAPNADVGVDGMIISIATVLAGAVTNPFNNGYFQGPATAPLEAVSACTGIFGSGSYPGYPGQVLVDKATGASFNAYGVNGRSCKRGPKVDCSTKGKKAEVVKKLENFTGWLMQRCHNCHPMLSCESHDSAHYMVRCCAVKPACWFIEKKNLGSHQDLRADAHSSFLPTTQTPNSLVHGILQPHLLYHLLSCFFPLSFRNCVWQLELC
nr:protein EXORDIUM-like 2 [Ipomoea batatas]